MCVDGGCPKVSLSTCGRIDRRKGSRTEIDESTDTWDTVDWLVNNVPGNNGKVGIAGISYPGFYTAAGIIDSHPAIKAASPQAPVNDWFVGDDWHHNGAFFLAHMFNWMSRNGRIRPEPTKEHHRARSTTARPTDSSFSAGSRRWVRLTQKYLKGDVPFWKETMQHGTYDDFWKSRQHPPAFEERQAGGDDGRRLVRRGEPVRGLGDLQVHRSQQSRRRSTCW